MYTWEDWVDPRPVGEDDGEEGVEGPAHPDQPHLPPTQFKQFLATYSVMQSDRNRWKIDTFGKALTSELMISS